ncbi:putative polysaccharide biosynthesis protein [Microcella alkaliphila]|uniref:Putative polysaccharide biosynthesis protein n=1 Tax=Microcella alkaliphila TaxID=279828 RepID=A0A4Q7TTC8_9MICO|nr:putative polysaccharide biosynthesis protein [Microcella alkaliphila]
MRQVGLRLRYLAERALRLNTANLIECARQAKRVSKAPLVIIILDMLWCSVRYEMAFRDYAVWDIRTLSGTERRTWMTHPKAFRLNSTLNAPNSRELLGDKPRFYRDFATEIGREWIDAQHASEEEVSRFLSRHARVMAKPPHGEGGAGIDILDTTDVLADVGTTLQSLREKHQTLLEEVVVQHPDLAALASHSVNTIRLITYRDPRDQFHLIAAVLRIGNQGIIDNFAAGGMFTMLDDDGVALWPAVDKQSNIYAKHPVSGVAIQGFRVPHFREAVELVTHASRRLPTVPYVGWDIAITAERPILIEANHNSSVFQMKPRASGIRTGLLHRYRAAVGPGILDRRSRRRVTTQV